MSLLLLFQGSGPPPSANGTAAAGAGACAAILAAKGASAIAAAVAGDQSMSTASRGASASAQAVAGGYAVSLFSRGASGIGRATGGAFARGQGGRGITADPTIAGAGAYARVRGRALRIGVPLSRLTRVVLSLDPSEVAFTILGKDGPYALLLSISPIRQAARAGRQNGIGISESTSCVVQFDNTSRRASRIIGRALRVHAKVYDGETLFFAGTVSEIAYGTTIDVTIEA